MSASDESAPEGKTPFVVHCGDCRHTWTAAWAPMEVGKFGRLLKGLRCPACAGDPKRIFCGPAPAKTSGDANAD